MPIFAIDPRAVEGALEATAEILSAEVRLGWPSSVSVRISERLPTVEWNDAGRTWWISADGLAYLPGESASGLVRIESTQHVLAVDEHELQPVVEPHLIQAAIELSGLLPEIEVFAYDPAYGLMITDEAGRRVYFGSSGDMAVKVGIYRSLAEKFSARGESVAAIHVEDSAAPYYRLEG
jgi:cell division septal protein FtsQ